MSMHVERDGQHVGLTGIVQHHPSQHAPRFSCTLLLMVRQERSMVISLGKGVKVDSAAYMCRVLSKCALSSARRMEYPSIIATVTTTSIFDLWLTCSKHRAALALALTA